MVLSLDDEPWTPSPRLLALSAGLAATTPTILHPLLSSRHAGGPRWFEHFPGEHYHLLTAICDLLKPAIVWEFGTDTGMSTVAMLEGLEPEAKIFTVDIDAWQTKPGAWVAADDFDSGRVTQLVCDMKSPALFSEHLDNLSRAELIFVDGPKDGSTESAFLRLLDIVPFRQNPIVIFDDIRLMNMVRIWREIEHPKMDLTSYGHWSGTGLVDWRNSGSPRPTTAPAPVASTIPAAPMDLSAGPTRILMLCHHKLNYVPDLLLHGLRKLLDTDVVDFPRKDALYDGHLGQPYLDPVVDLMAQDSAVDRNDINSKLRNGFFDLVLCDIRAVNDNRALLEDSRCPLALIDGEDRPAPIKPGSYVILRRETDGGDFSVPLPMAIPVEVLGWIDRHQQMPKTHSIAFLGSRSSLTAERNALIDEVDRRFPDALIDSWAVSSGKWQSRDAYYQALQSCRAVLTLPGAGFDTFRYWENAACRAAHVAPRMPLYIHNDFRDGYDILRFSDITELTRAIERIASGNLDWLALAEGSRRRLLAHHTTERRAADTLDRLKAAFLR